MLFTIIILLMSVVIHEVSHGYAALALGDITAKHEGRLTLNPLKHLDPVGSIILPAIGILTGGFILGWAKPVPFNPYNLHPEKFGLPARSGNAIVAFAGPLSNILIALIFGTLIRFGGNFWSPAFISLSSSVILINIILAIFNLMPIPPLDGSKILWSFLPHRFEGVLYQLERMGIVLVFFFVFFLWQVLNPLVYWAFRLFTGL